MAENKHFSHQHSLTFHKSLEAAQLTCSGCKFPCTGTPIYSCRPCKFFLHEQCFHATRTLNHPLHPNHNLSLFPSPTYSPGSFLCNLCSKSGSGFCFSCTTCEFDLHVHCAYNDPRNGKSKTSPPPNQVQIVSHPNHPLRYYYKPPYENQLCVCDVCGTQCDSNSPLYHCDTCGNDAHVECVNLPETVRREDHPHALSLLHVNPYEEFECDVCRGTITKTHCMYLCKSGCDYGIHVKCVSAQVKVNEKKPKRSDREFQLEMFRLQSQFQLDVFNVLKYYYTKCIKCVKSTIMTSSIFRKKKLLLKQCFNKSYRYGRPYVTCRCNVCRGSIAKKQCLYLCKSGCDYRIHVKCVTAKLTEKTQMKDQRFKIKMFKLHN